MSPSSSRATGTFNDRTVLQTEPASQQARKVCVRSQALASIVTTLFLLPTQGSASSARSGELGGTGTATAQRGPCARVFESLQRRVLVRHGLGERAPAPLSLLQPVQDELAGVNESLYAVNKACFCPGIQLWPGFIHALLLETEKDPRSQNHRLYLLIFSGIYLLVYT